VKPIASKAGATKMTTVKAVAKTTASEGATVKTAPAKSTAPEPAATKAAGTAVETAATKVTPTATVSSATKSPTATAMRKRPCGWTEHKQRGANYTKYCFCFHRPTVAPAASSCHCESV
jgi:hypothetical protein